MPGYDQGVHSRGYLYFVVVPVHREVFDVIPDSLMLIVRVQRVGTVLRGLTMRGCAMDWRTLMLEGLLRPRWGLGVTLVSMVVVMV